MADKRSQPATDSEAANAVLRALEEAGLFRQFTDLEVKLKRIAEDVSAIGQVATQRLQEIEDMAAHIMAIESILTVLVRDHPVDVQAVSEEARQRTAALTNRPDGSPAVNAVIAQLLSRIET